MNVNQFEKELFGDPKNFPNAYCPGCGKPVHLRVVNDQGILQWATADSFSTECEKILPWDAQIQYRTHSAWIAYVYDDKNAPDQICFGCGVKIHWVESLDPETNSWYDSEDRGMCTGGHTHTVNRRAIYEEFQKYRQRARELASRARYVAGKTWDDHANTALVGTDTGPMDTTTGRVPDETSTSGKELHPKHYNVHKSGIECIEIIATMPTCLGTAVKHLHRAGLKGGASYEQDLSKAINYTKFAIEYLKAEWIASRYNSDSELVYKYILGFPVSNVRAALTMLLCHDEEIKLRNLEFEDAITLLERAITEHQALS